MWTGVTSAGIITQATAWAVPIAGIVLIAVGYRVVLRLANWIVGKFGGGAAGKRRR